MFGLQPTHLLIILIAAMVFFIPSRLPEFGRALRQTIVELRNSSKGIARDTTQEPSESPRSEK